MLTILLMHPRHMGAKGIFTCKCFLTMVALVTKMPREVGAFNMIPHIGPVSGLLPALGTLVVPLPILKHWLLHVLVKHSSCAKMSWEIKIKFIHMVTSNVGLQNLFRVCAAILPNRFVSDLWKNIYWQSRHLTWLVSKEYHNFPSLCSLEMWLQRAVLLLKVFSHWLQL